MGFIISCIATAVATYACVFFLPGVTLVGAGEAWIAIAAFAVVLTLVDMIVKPILRVLSFPITFLTLGLFNLVINTVMLMLASYLSVSAFGAGVMFDTFFTTLIASLIISIVSSIVGAILHKDK